MQSLIIDVHNDKTQISFVDNGQTIYTFNSPLGHTHLKQNNFSKSSARDWYSYVVWVLQNISYLDRVPGIFYVKIYENDLFYKTVVQTYTYAQFFIKNKDNSNKPHVIIEYKEDSGEHFLSYARYKKTISQFKV